jgi:hypothetical protein
MSRFKHPLFWLATIIFYSGFLSAFFVITQDFEPWGYVSFASLVAALLLWKWTRLLK